MNSDDIKALARLKTPVVPLTRHAHQYRHNVIDRLNGSANVGIELGVAQGIFSKRMVDSNKFSMFYGVDVYADMHDTDEYKNALRRVGIASAYKLLRMRFDDALDLFPDRFFDFIYVDGYAHTGEEGGRTLTDWYPKLKVGGVMAGDDYHDDWPLVQWAVNSFVDQIGAELHLTGQIEAENYCRYPSWYFCRRDAVDRRLAAPQDLAAAGHSERDRIARLRNPASRPLPQASAAVAQPEPAAAPGPAYLRAVSEVLQPYAGPA